jgi:U3 small nucleolar RNA-associated protein 12
MGFSLRTTLPSIKLGHREQLSGGVGTGRALNSDQIVCLDVAQPQQQQQGDGGVYKVATGWVDGAVRIFDVNAKEWNNTTTTSEGGYGLVQTLLQEYSSSEQENFVLREPLVLNGHSASPVRTVTFCPQTGTRLASGSSDGSVVLWDIIAETGLFRLLGHRGGITDIQFVHLPASTTASAGEDYLITSSLDGLVKVWDLKGQCCTQTIPNHKGEVWGAACQTIPSMSTSQRQTKDGGNGEEPEKDRVRLLTGSNDGQVRVWSVQTPKRLIPKPKMPIVNKIARDEMEDVDSSIQTKNAARLSTSVALVEKEKNDQNKEDEEDVDQDNVCTYMGSIISPPNVTTSSERISCIHFHPNGRYVGVLHANSKTVDVFVIRSTQESIRKKQRRLRRRKEKSKIHGKAAVEGNSSSTKGQKRGMLDDPESEHDDDTLNPTAATTSELVTLEQSLDPEMIKASDEFEYYGTVRASHKVKGFVFASMKEKGAGIRVVCALSTNALETHSLVRKKES